PFPPPAASAAPSVKPNVGPPPHRIDVGPEANPPSEPYIVEFFYATNRKESAEPAPWEGHLQTQVSSNPIYGSTGWTPVSGYRGERSTDVSFCAIRVRVPEGHQIGKIELPSGARIFGITLVKDAPNQTKHFTLRSIARTSEDQWIRSLSSTKKKRALIFV